MVKSQIRYASSYIAENEVVHDTKFIKKEMYVRYYHDKIIPTRYFISRSGKVWSEIVRDFITPHYLYRNDNYGNTIKSKGKYVRLYIRINGQRKNVTRNLNRIIEDTFDHLQISEKKRSKK